SIQALATVARPGGMLWAASPGEAARRTSTSRSKTARARASIAGGMIDSAGAAANTVAAPAWKNNSPASTSGRAPRTHAAARSRTQASLRIQGSGFILPPAPANVNVGKGCPGPRVGKDGTILNQGGNVHALGARGAGSPLGRGRGSGRRAAHGAVWRACQAAVGLFAAANLWPRVLEPHPGNHRRAVSAPTAHRPALLFRRLAGPRSRGSPGLRPTVPAAGDPQDPAHLAPGFPVPCPSFRQPRLLSAGCASPAAVTAPGVHRDPAPHPRCGLL